MSTLYLLNKIKTKCIKLRLNIMIEYKYNCIYNIILYVLF